VLVAGEETSESLSTCTWPQHLAAVAHQSSEREKDEADGRGTSDRLLVGRFFFSTSSFKISVCFIFLSLPFNFLFFCQFRVYSLYWTLSMASTTFVLNNRNK
jgi:hypothetical protein